MPTVPDARASDVLAPQLAPQISAEISAGLAAVKLVALDVDGVLTDGRIVYGKGGVDDEQMTFHVRDGIGLRWLADAGIAVAWITGRGCAATRSRAAELGITRLVERAGPKGEELARVQRELGCERSATLAMGDDLPDLPMRGACALFVAPADAEAEVRARADLVTAAGGGRGAVRELCELLLRAQGRWSALVDAAAR